MPGINAFARAILAATILLLALPCGPVHAQKDAPVIAAAADLQFALTDAAEAFRKETGHDVRVSFGSSGNFARQIRQGAPFELFFSADEAFVDALATDGLMRDPGLLYGIGRIVLIVPTGSPLAADGSLEDLKAALGDGRLKKFAIANPDHAPYGKRAQEALEYKGLWDGIKDKLVLGENVAQAAQFVTSANAQGGLIAYSLALSAKVSERATYQLIPEAWHAPLRQRMALTKKAGAVAGAFYEFAQAPTARAIFRKYGFVLPGEPSN